MPQKFSVSVKVTYKKDGDEPVPGRLPSKKGIHDYLKSKRYVTALAKRIAPVGGVTVSGVNLDEQLNLTFTATYNRNTTASRVREEMSDSVGIEKCSGSEFPGPCFIPTANGKRILGHVKIMSVKVKSNMSTTSPKRKELARERLAKRLEVIKMPATPKRRSSLKSSGKPCRDPSKIRNPATGRCVSRTGPTGRKILSGKL